MAFDLGEALAILERTPATLRALLTGLPEGWIAADEGPETWSPFVVVGHLIHGEKSDWVERARIIRRHGDARAFEPFDRFAQLEASRGQTLGELLDEFEERRAANLEIVRGWSLGEDELDLRGRHPELGGVTMRQLLATWVVHDLGHLAQIARVMAKQYAGEVGVWEAYLPVLGDRPGSGGGSG